MFNISNIKFLNSSNNKKLKKYMHDAIIELCSIENYLWLPDNLTIYIAKDFKNAVINNITDNNLRNSHIITDEEYARGDAYSKINIKDTSFKVEIYFDLKSLEGRIKSYNIAKNYLSMHTINHELVHATEKNIICNRIGKNYYTAQWNDKSQFIMPIVFRSWSEYFAFRYGNFIPGFELSKEDLHIIAKYISLLLNFLDLLPQKIEYAKAYHRNHQDVDFTSTLFFKYIKQLFVFFSTVIGIDHSLNGILFKKYSMKEKIANDYILNLCNNLEQEYINLYESFPNWDLFSNFNHLYHIIEDVYNYFDIHLINREEGQVFIGWDSC